MTQTDRESDYYIGGGLCLRRPKVKLLHYNPMIVSEIAARTCYDSFDKAKDPKVASYRFGDDLPGDIEESDLLDNLSHVLQHESILEHIHLNYHIKDTSRGVLQELARHRMANFSVRSTRYTMGPIINVAVFIQLQMVKFKQHDNVDPIALLHRFIKERDVFVYHEESEDVLDRDIHHLINGIMKTIQSNGALSYASKDLLEYVGESSLNYQTVVEASKRKSKKNVGDDFKYLVNDSWATELIFTINVRSLKNFLKLRDSGAAWFQICELASEIVEATPEKILKLCHRSYGLARRLYGES